MSAGHTSGAAPGQRKSPRRTAQASPALFLGEKCAAQSKYQLPPRRLLRLLRLVPRLRLGELLERAFVRELLRGERARLRDERSRLEERTARSFERREERDGVVARSREGLRPRRVDSPDERLGVRLPRPTSPLDRPPLLRPVERPTSPRLWPVLRPVERPAARPLRPSSSRERTARPRLASPAERPVVLLTARPREAARPS